MTGGITALFKANGVVGLQGHGAAAAGPARCVVTAPDGKRDDAEAKHVVLASRLRADPAEHGAARRRAHRRFLECARVRRGARSARRDRRGRHRARARQRLAPTRKRGDGARSAATLSCRWWTRPRQGGARQFKKQGLDIKLGAKVARAGGRRRRRRRGLHGRAGRAHAAGATSSWSRSAGGPSPRGCSADGSGVDARRARLHPGGRALPHRAPNVWAVGDVRARTDARAQGQGGGHHGGRSDRRPATAR